tara:strand:- start:727 stop:1320 length:594 start_codon:yes stop_codon:yes gene_type:complete
MILKHAYILKSTLLITLVLAEQKPTVAIVDFDSYGVGKNQVNMLVERLRTEIGNTKAVRLIERNAVDKIMEEQKFQLAGLTSNNIAAQIGNLLGAQFMINGVIGKIGDKYTIDCKMFSVETSETIRTSNTTFEGNISGLLLEIQIMAWDIVNEEPPQNLKLQKYHRAQAITNSNPNWLVWALILFAAGGGAFLAMGW